MHLRTLPGDRPKPPARRPVARRDITDMAPLLLWLAIWVMVLIGAAR